MEQRMHGPTRMEPPILPKKEEPLRPFTHGVAALSGPGLFLGAQNLDFSVFELLLVLGV